MWVLGTQTLGLSKTVVSSPCLVWLYAEFWPLAEERDRGFHVGLLPRGLPQPQKAMNCARASQLLSSWVN